MRRDQGIDGLLCHYCRAGSRDGFRLQRRGGACDENSKNRRFISRRRPGKLDDYYIGVWYAHRLHSLESCDETRKKDQHVCDVVHLAGRLGDNLPVEQLRADSGGKSDFRCSYRHVIRPDDGVLGGSSRLEVARHNGHVDQRLHRFLSSHRLHLWIFFKDDWRSVALICAVFPVIAISLIILVLPESPLWLRDQNRPEEALEIMKRFRGIPKDQPAPAELILELKPRPQKKNQNLLQHLVKRSSLVPFGIMLSYFFFQQFSGIFVVIYNAVGIMQKSGIQIDPYIGAILIGASRFSVSLLTAFISRKYGRRIPSIISGIGMTIFIGCLSIYLYLSENGIEMSDNGIIPVVCMMMYIFTSALGYLIIPFAMVGEIYPSKVKDILSNLTVAIGYIFSAITVKTYPDMERLMNMEGVFLFFAIISFIGVIFIWFFLPETKGKTLREIEDMFSKKKAFELPAELPIVEGKKASNAVDSQRN
ncbi:facilitated trehalose transporter Tret1-2 homolog [Nylanderia fulva]|uniref:facilitated trehalose transporter Tret1-2 homolog n=1 Tax=Nylanderia fulva TaxID=613905 RepID=UPI0010FB4536|nr:facilitated trehalose transporter Tret1-2 homolog [Nylanderia fulva]